MPSFKIINAQYKFWRGRFTIWSCAVNLLFKSDICNTISNKKYIKKVIIDVKCIAIKIIN